MCSGDLYPYADCQRSSVASGCSCWRRAPLGDRTQSVQTTVRIVLLFPSVLSLSFQGESKTSNVFFFFLRIWLFLSSPSFQDGFLR